MHVLLDMPEQDAKIVKLFLEELTRGETYGRGDALELRDADLCV